MLEANIKNNSDSNEIENIILKDIINTDTTHLVMKTIIRELLEIELFSIEKCDDGFTAKGEDKNGKVHDYFILVEDFSILMALDNKIANSISIRNLSLLKKIIPDDAIFLTKINFSTYDNIDVSNPVDIFRLQEENENSDLYSNLLAIFNINLPKIKEESSNKIEKTMFERVCLMILSKTKEKTNFIPKEGHNFFN